MGITRRSLLQLMAGASAGMMVSPLPWKLLDDVSIWTQTWFLTPKLIRDEISHTFATCGMCNGGCGIRVRRLGDIPIAVTGQDNHPLSHGGVCPLGMTGPQLRFHPTRIAKPVMKNSAGEFVKATPKEAIAKIGSALGACKKSAPDTFAVLCARPESAMSRVYEQLISAVGQGFVISPPGLHTAVRSAVGEVFGDTVHGIGYDLENAKTVLSIGAPLYEGWSSLGRMAGIKRVWQQTNSSKRTQLIVADPHHTMTVSAADTWLAINPGSELALALGLGHLLLKDNLLNPDVAANFADLEEYRQLTAAYTLEKTAASTGLEPGRITETAKALATTGPAIILGGGGVGSGPLGQEEEIAILGLNLLLGNYGKPGGTFPDATWPPEKKIESAETAPVKDQSGSEPLQPEQVETVLAQENANSNPPKHQPISTKTLDQIPAGTLRLLILDSALPNSQFPWRLIQDKMAQNGLVVSLNPFLSGANLNAHVVLPTAVPYEWEFDMPTTAGDARPTYGLSPKLADPPPGLVSPPEMLALIAKAGGVSFQHNSHVDIMRQTMEKILSAGRGNVFDPAKSKTIPLSSLKSIENLHKILTKGGTWMGDLETKAPLPKTHLLGSATVGRVRFAEVIKKGRVEELTGSTEKYPLILMPYGHHGEANGGAVPQLFTKLYRETNLRQLFLHAHINPETGIEQGLRSDCRAELKTEVGSLAVTVVFDRAVMPGTIRVAAGPDPLSLGDVSTGQFATILDVTEVTERGIWRLTRASLKEVGHV